MNHTCISHCAIFAGASLKTATVESLVAADLGLKKRHAKRVIEKRDEVLAQPAGSRIERVNTDEAGEEVASFGPMSDWTVAEVLRLINSVDGDLFEEVKQQCLALDFSGECLQVD